VTKCKNCQKTIVADTIYEGGWAHETPVPHHDADICHEILTAEPELETSIAIDFTADELQGMAQAMRITGDTFSTFIDRAIKNTIERYENGRP